MPLALPPTSHSPERRSTGWRLRAHQAGEALGHMGQLLHPPAGVLFTLRTTFAALIALGIAFRMELDSPAWAPLTVWVVAQPTRGESLSKARWRIVGTLGGGLFALLLSALVPQAPWLFYIGLALWTALCTGLGSFATNFRAYAWSLAGFTGAIIAVDAAPDANNVFTVAMSRCTYIMLGIVCELSVAAVFSVDPSKQARRALHLSLMQALKEVTVIVSAALTPTGQEATSGGASNHAPLLAQAEQQLGAVLALDNRIEFLALEIGPHTRAGDHARAALAALGSALVRVFGTALRLRGHAQLLREAAPLLGSSSAAGAISFAELATLFRQARALLAHVQDCAAMKGAAFQQAAALLVPQLHTMREACLAPIPALMQRSLALGRHLPAAPEAGSAHSETLPVLAALQVGLTSLASVLADLATALAQASASARATREPGADGSFRFARRPWHDGVYAWQNGLRAFLCVLMTAYVYEVTAWTEGLPYIIYTAVICCVFGPRPMQKAATMGYLYGTLAAAAVAFWVVILGIPSVRTFEPLALIIGAALMLSAPFRTRPSTGPACVTYGFMLMLMCGLDNQRDMNEIQYFNKALSEILSSASAVVAFRTIFPFNLRQAAFRVRRSMLGDLHLLVRPGPVPDEARWISRSLDRFAHLATRAGETRVDERAVRRFLYGLLATLALGMNLLRLRRLMQAGLLPPGLKPVLESVLGCFAGRRIDIPVLITRVHEARLALLKLAPDAVTALAGKEGAVLNIAYALGCLLGIEQLVENNQAFLDPTHSIWRPEEVE
ncbi:FUSC family protein [Oecophyllibacter saccharovorans]|uniref:FUSC family protein n=1 Tax=Oecophyllibacter saccharovorans TaxID=2558360 RepID=A0A506URQ9_9PROT|nr:FUSC family protein [Oecophyllibacter saccharovorans]TPW36034.1 FUSC family protein [Oecophyllibacter saccharovorans]